MKIIEGEQYSPGWWAARRGIPTASCAGKLITGTGKPSTQAKGYAYELLANELTQEDEQIKASEWMIRGLELEPEARAYLSLKLGKAIDEVGFCLDDTETIGASPDGIFSDEFICEIKVPKASTHVSYLLGNKLPITYKPQVHWQMFVTGLPCIFFSYHPKLDPLIIKVTPDEYTKQIGAMALLFAKDLQKMREQLND